MAALQDIVAYLLSEYPHKYELSNARVTKMVYLADWKSAIDSEHQMSEIQWYFDNFGPFVRDILAVVQSCPELFRVVETQNAFGEPKRVFQLVQPSYSANLTANERQTLDHVIDATKDLSWDKFIKFVYSTYPVLSSDRYSPLDLVAKAHEYKVPAL